MKTELKIAFTTITLAILACNILSPATPPSPTLQPPPTIAIPDDGSFVRLEVIEGDTRIVGDPTEGQFLIITGEVVNNTDTWVKAPQVYIRIYDASGNLIREEAAFFAERSRIPPHSTSAFRFTRDLAKIEGEPASQVIEAFAIPTDDSQQAVIDNLQTAPDGNHLQVSGDFKSTGTEACHVPRVIVTLRSGGKVMESDNYLIDLGSDLDLPSGESVHFDEIVNDAAAYDVTVETSCGA